MPAYIQGLSRLKIKNLGGQIFVFFTQIVYIDLARRTNGTAKKDKIFNKTVF